MTPSQRRDQATPFHVGARVELKGPNALYHGCAHGTVHALYDGQEDTIEVLLDNGTYTCVDPRHLRSAS